VRAEQLRAAHGDLPPVDLGPHAQPGQRAKAAHLAMSIPAGRDDDGARQGVLAVAFDGGGEAQHVVAAPPVQGDDVTDLRTSLGERTGLVEGDDPQVGGLLEVRAALDQDPVPCRVAESGEDAHRRRDHQRARTGDDQQREAAVDPRAPRPAEDERRHEDDGGREGDHGRCVARRKAVDDRLGWGARRLRLLHEVDDLGDGGVGGRRRRTHA